MARKRASMREGPLAELFRATEAAQRQEGDDEPVDEPLPPAAEVDDQQTLIQEPPADPPEVPHRRGSGARRRRSRRPSSTSTTSTSSLPREPVAVEARIVPEPVADRPRGEARAAVRAPGEPVPAADAGGCAEAQRRRRGRLVPRSHPCRRGRRRGTERGQPDDGCRHRPGRLRRCQHGHAAAQPLGRTR